MTDYGPNSEAVAAFIERCRTLTPDQAKRLGAAWDATRDAPAPAAGWAALAAARSAAWGAGRSAAWYAAGWAGWWAAWGAAGDAAWAMVVRDLITPAQYAILVQPFVDAGLGEWVA